MVAYNLGSTLTISKRNHTTPNIFLHFTGFSKLSPLSDMEITLVKLPLSTFSPLSWSSWVSPSSHSLWVQSMVFLTQLILSRISLKRSQILSTCGSKRQRNLTSHTIFNQLSITTSENMLSKPFCTISIWSSRSLISINKLPQKCRLKSFKTPECSKSLKNRSITFSMSVKEGSRMS